MGVSGLLEIERKFLVKGDFKGSAREAVHIVQGYICSVPERNVRVRLRGKQAFLTIKGVSEDGGLSRFEWEKEISPEEGMELIRVCEPGVIDKIRYIIPVGSHVYEVDEFHGDNEGLIVAEIELSSPDECFERPEWLGEEVTGDKRYYNSSLVKSPYKGWS